MPVGDICWRTWAFWHQLIFLNHCQSQIFEHSHLPVLHWLWNRGTSGYLVPTVGEPVSLQSPKGCTGDQQDTIVRRALTCLAHSRPGFHPQHPTWCLGEPIGVESGGSPEHCWVWLNSKQQKQNREPTRAWSEPAPAGARDKPQVLSMCPACQVYTCPL